MLFLLGLLFLCSTGFARSLEPLITPRALGLAGAVVASPADPTSVLFNPAGIGALRQMGSDFSFGTRAGGTDRWLWSYANPSAEEGGRFGFGSYVDGQTQPADCKFIVPYVAAAWQPMGRLSIGAVGHLIHEYQKKTNMESRWSNSFDVGVLTPGERLNFGANVRHAFGGTSVVKKSLQWGASVRSDNQKMLIAYQWDGDLLSGVKYKYASSRLGAEYQVSEVASVRAGYIWSDTHRITAGGAIGSRGGGSLIQLGASVPTKGKAPTEWSVGLSYRI